VTGQKLLCQRIELLWCLLVLCVLPFGCHCEFLQVPTRTFCGRTQRFGHEDTRWDFSLLKQGSVSFMSH
jgi:hypothetical protein